MAKVFVYITGLIFLTYGALFSVFPIEMSYWITGSYPQGASAIIDLRATYGGAQFAIGALLLLVTKLKNDVDMALLMVALILLSMAFSRTLGIVLDGQANGLMFVYLAGEIVGGLAALYLSTSVTVKKK